MSTNLVDVITYEFFDRENDDALKGLIKFLDLAGGENDILNGSDVLINGESLFGEQN